VQDQQFILPLTTVWLDLKYLLFWILTIKAYWKLNTQDGNLPQGRRDDEMEDKD
jgi:hypothetical protein